MFENFKKIKMPKKFSAWHIVIAVGFFILLQLYLLNPGVRDVSYSEFKRLVREGTVLECHITNTLIRGKLREIEHGTRKNVIFITARVDDPDLVKELEFTGVKYSGNYESPWFKTFFFTWVMPLLILFIIWRFIFRRFGPASSIMSFGKSKGRLYAQEDLNVTFDDVAGIDEAKEELQEIIEFLKTPEKFRALGGKIPKGVLLLGAPGTGKTLLSKAVAGEAGVPFFNMSGSEFVEMFVGVGAARVRDLFNQADQKAPCIIFIDELDALGKARGVNPMGGHDEREQTLNQLLVEMDGFDSNKGVIIMGATNRPEMLDPALLRPGRFDRQVVVDRPDLHGREAILKVHAKEVKLEKDINLHSVAAMTPGFVGADLANLVNEAALLAARRNKKAVGMPEFEEAIDRIMTGLEKKKRLMNKKEKEIVAHHESGHALIACSVPHADPVRKISMIPRGIGALGYTLQKPTEDRYLMTKAELLDRIAILLGGRVSEEIIFNEISTGAQNDLEKATEIAKMMVKEYGMSAKMGLVTYEQGDRPLFLGGGFAAKKEHSEETAREIDLEIKKIIDESSERARNILTEKKEILKGMANTLMEKEVIEGDELKKLLEELHKTNGGKGP
ncbi:MAG TPA: ATP-dependent zinc metalloprotease FtsH [Candidatus Wujingus californicus]|uniref:ATP-dependent zinc metalloprotease FtsH n=3 Tax=Candidatus Wujingus californicus TaxID=3367618 RepID=UPI001D9805E1|nr:ATP-dependent metallopeptidase FtsH/Yme1/Tma family protein [Planctomycetota bacterium]MDO8130316.1 ATP-dependent zinc metalloprotease FtsH [Candidatus Brocadiales bacterium]